MTLVKVSKTKTKTLPSENSGENIQVWRDDLVVIVDELAARLSRRPDGPANWAKLRGAVFGGIPNDC